METDKKSAVKPVASIKTAAVRSGAQIVIPEVVIKEETVKKPALKNVKAVKKVAEKTVKKAVKGKAETAKKAVKEKLPVKKNEPKVRIVLQYGDQTVEADTMIATAKKIIQDEPNSAVVKKLDLYVKPEEGKVYYVADDNKTGSFDM